MVFKKLEKETNYEMNQRISKYWKENKIFEKSVDNREERFVFYDGPIYANAKPGLHHMYAKEIKDDIPDGLEFLPDNATNKKYGWKLLDEKGNEVKEVNKAKYIVTDYLSKDNESKDGENLLKAFNKKDYTDGKVTSWNRLYRCDWPSELKDAMR